MLYFISDLHFDHEFILRIRDGFKRVEYMNEYLIKNWNAKVTDHDEVYILGDFSFRSKKSVHRYLSRLKGKKHLIIGNHDDEWMKEVGDLSMYFESVSKLKILQLEGQEIVLCHYPLLEWPGKSYMIHGHIHGNKNTLTYRLIKEHFPLMLNACVEVNRYEPVTLNELLKNNEEWYER